MKKERTLADTEEFIQNAARHYGWAANPDDEFRSTIAEGLTTNANRFGYYMCPCRDGDGDRDADADIVCPCAYAGPDIDDFGQCFCGLFLSRERVENGKTEVDQIPERRSW